MREFVCVEFVGVFEVEFLFARVASAHHRVRIVVLWIESEI